MAHTGKVKAALATLYDLIQRMTPTADGKDNDNVKYLKSVFDKIRFDEINYKGFHFYDLDISLQVYMLGLKSLCVYDILIEHVSNSKLDNEWLTNARIFFTKWKDCLPIVNYPVSAKERRVLEKNNLQTMNYIINENNRKPSHYYKFSEKLYLLRYCCDKKMLQSLIY
mgnify:CR=1 FL=1